MSAMRRHIPTFAVLGGALIWASCSTPLCQLGSYDRGTGMCPAERNAVAVSFDSDRTDLRTTASLVIHIQAMITDTNTPLDVVEVESVALSLADASFVPVPATLGDDKRSVLVARSPEPLALGLLRAEVTLPGLPGAYTTELHRVFRAPKLGPMEVVQGMTSPNYSGAVQGRVAVQIASPFGTAGQLLITDEVNFSGANQRWLDLYAQSASGMLGYVDSAAWRNAVRLKESTAALLNLIPGGIVIYDLDTTTKRNDLSVVQLNGPRQNGLSMAEPKIPADAVAMAASSEESAVLLARSTEVLVFHTDFAPAAKAVSYIGTLSVAAGPPVVAARDVHATPTAPGLADYFAVVWDTTGQGTLLVLNKNAGVPTGITPVPINSGVGVAGITAAALVDLDSDGLQDLIFAKADGTLMWSPQHPDSSFQGSESLNVSIPGAVSISVGDLNGDSLPDLAVATKDKKVVIFRNQP